jgi:NADH dehydrogenase
VNAERIAITGGTGFVGRHFADLLRERGHEPVLICRRVPPEPPQGRVHALGLDDVDALVRAFTGCGAVAHLAGINRELGEQTYQRVHVAGTRNVLEAARRAGVLRIALLSFLRARPDCGSAYHESKFAAEELVRRSGLQYMVLKSGVIYGRGDHLLDHLSHALYTLPLFATVGASQPPLRPVAVRDVARVLFAALVEGRLAGRTVSVLGPEVLSMREVVTRMGDAIGRRPTVFPLPVAFHRLLARAAEATMKVPLVSVAQVRMLAEGLYEPAPPCDDLPDDLKPAIRFTAESIASGLPEPGRFGRADLRLGGWCGTLFPESRR